MLMNLDHSSISLRKRFIDSGLHTAKKAPEEAARNKTLFLYKRIDLMTRTYDQARATSFGLQMVVGKNPP